MKTQQKSAILTRGLIPLVNNADIIAMLAQFVLTICKARTEESRNTIEVNSGWLKFDKKHGKINNNGYSSANSGETFPTGFVLPQTAERHFRQNLSFRKQRRNISNRIRPSADNISRYFKNNTINGKRIIFNKNFKHPL